MQDYFKHESAYVDEGCIIGKGTKIWHFSHIMQDCKIGENCNIGQNVVVSPGVTLGNGCKVQNNVSVYEGVTCEDDVFLGPSMVFTNVINPRAFIERKSEFQPTLVRQGATVGANATIVCGHTIGRYAMIGAGAVITHDVPDYALMTGNPARQTGWVSESGCRLDFDEKGFEWIDGSDVEHSVISFIRKSMDPDDFIISVSNFTPQVWHNYKVGVDRAGVYQEILNSDDIKYNGSGVVNGQDLKTSSNGWNFKKYSLNLTLPPLSTIIIKPKVLDDDV
jgi:UDP-2-acetamido-3-amino-2,3-dideoxy-glucuronate N-acetyltransferase